MGAIICFGAGMFMRTWLQCLAIGAAMAAADILLYWGPKVRDREIPYLVGYLGAVFVLDIVVALFGHGLRRLYLRFRNA